MKFTCYHCGFKIKSNSSDIHKGKTQCPNCSYFLKEKYFILSNKLTRNFIAILVYSTLSIANLFYLVFAFHFFGSIYNNAIFALVCWIISMIAIITIIFFFIGLFYKKFCLKSVPKI